MTLELHSKSFASLTHSQIFIGTKISSFSHDLQSNKPCYGYLKMSLSALSARKDKTFALISLSKMQQQSLANSQFSNSS